MSKPQSYIALVSQEKLILEEGYNGLLLFQCTDHGLVVQESRHIVQMLGETGTMSPHLPQILYPNPVANSFFMLASQTDTRVYVSATDCMYRVSQKRNFLNCWTQVALIMGFLLESPLESCHRHSVVLSISSTSRVLTQGFVQTSRM